MLLQEKGLASQKYKSEDAKFDADVELDAYKFLGAYLGAMTPLHFAILLGQDDIAKDIIERSFKEDLEETFGGGNTALHLGAVDIVTLLLERGANRTVNNAKGFQPVDLSDDPELRKLFVSTK
ncbi:hypothetical protein HK103_007311 [Boothiomyces macroporosus]|uniref:Ankyrin repeat protein n=1 Tax=Boothiomyces macroporosus TaxID=261099 RepID=A0AAD5Y1V2_9FUNG|nr:hypothetical protein HK103_007311 [Boothiomyces macroporosus]